MVHHIPFDRMEQLMIDVFKGIGVPVNEALQKSMLTMLTMRNELGLDYHFDFEE